MIRILALLAPLAIIASCAECTDTDPTQDESSVTEVCQVVTEAALAEMSVDGIWGLGVKRLHWDPTGPPNDAAKTEIIQWFLTDEGIKDIADDGILFDR